VPAPLAESRTGDPVMTPSGVRVRRFAPPPAVVPPVVAAPNAVTAPVPAAVLPSIGFQRGLAAPLRPPVPVAPSVPLPASQAPPAPIVQSPVAVPQAPPPAAQSGRQLGRGLMGGFERSP